MFIRTVEIDQSWNLVEVDGHELMDTLSKIFAAPRIKEAKFTRLEASAPWGIVSPGERVVKFVHVVGGSAVLATPTVRTILGSSAACIPLARRCRVQNLR